MALGAILIIVAFFLAVFAALIETIKGYNPVSALLFGGAGVSLIVSVLISVG